ncbi:maleylpyruvate isomerase family mycothiol-dependent enzyme [Nocardioides marinquilinus]|uniref:Maleylpyruvate isomerase family mycothiol-dependent enzyme n=1 Tax=Nocardioides marinquilinus TaxID=1210400 RepID=A0ABP9PTL8_9ACTN
MHPQDDAAPPTTPPVLDVPPGLGVDLQEATQRLVRTVDGLTDDDHRGPSLLPGWTRAHVVAHLALNAEALVEALDGVLAGEPVPMYVSQEARDADIEALAAADPATLRGRLFAGGTRLGDALAGLDGAPLETAATVVRRTADGERTFLAGEVVLMRLREVEIHHVDLDAGHGRDAWPPTFSSLLVDDLRGRTAATLVLTDLDRRYEADAGEPTVSGTAADLGWWLSGRGDGAGLTCDLGPVPPVAAW